MKITYPGPYQSVVVPGVGRVDKGQPVDVPDDRAESLLAQGWRKPKTAAKKTAAKTTRKER